jgi:hypothetical protein
MELQKSLTRTAPTFLVDIGAPSPITPGNRATNLIRNVLPSTDWAVPDLVGLRIRLSTQLSALSYF